MFANRFSAADIPASFADESIALEASAGHDFCKVGELACIGTNQCIPNEHWCDSIVDCLDASDETECSCESRLNPRKICDGYSDCPFDTDEIGCFGCDKDSYSCYDNQAEFDYAQYSVLPRCYTPLERCDGFRNCLNGKDEQGCLILVKNVGPPENFLRPNVKGYLHRNYKGRWYPVCDEPMEWAREVCEAEIGPLDKDPAVMHKSVQLPGPFISHVSIRRYSTVKWLLRFSETCSVADGHSGGDVYVKCPKTKCGTVKKPEQASSIRSRGKHSDRRKPDENMVGIVGGTRAEPQKWPFVIALYKNGRFHCGGIIHSESWVIALASNDGDFPRFS